VTHPQEWHASSDIGPIFYEPYNVYFQTQSINPEDMDLSHNMKGTNQTGLEHIFNNVATGITNQYVSPAVKNWIQAD
jgi:hypothetical protein